MNKIYWILGGTCTFGASVGFIALSWAALVGDVETAAVGGMTFMFFCLMTTLCARKIR